MRFRKSFVCSLIVGSFIVSSCTTETIEIPNEELYTREFIKQFGVADPDHDWNNATQGSVTVITSTPTNVQVLADIRGDRYIFADYRGVNGSETINFTIPKGVSDIIVTLNGRQVKSTLGATIDTRSRNSRTTWETHDDIAQISSGDYRIISDNDVKSYRNYLPEGSDNRGKVTQNFTFTANGDFIIYPVYWQTGGYNTIGIYYIDEENNEMVHIPVYSNKIAPSSDGAGDLLYTYDENYATAEDLYPPKTYSLKDANTPWIQVIDDPTKYNSRGIDDFTEFTPDDWETFKRRWLSEERSKNFRIFPEQYFDLQDFYQWLNNNDGWNNTPDKFYYTNIKCHAKSAKEVAITSISINGYNTTWKSPGSSIESYPSGNEAPIAWRSKAINISMKSGTKFGMYVRAWWQNDTDSDGNSIESPSAFNTDIVRLKLDDAGMPISDGLRRFYSDSKYNNCTQTHQDGTANHVHAATYIYENNGEKFRVLGFEDAVDNDLNDMIFFISSIDPEKIPDVTDIDKPDPVIKKYDFLIAAEDLGGTCDWDFNDMVVGVNVLSTNYIAANSDTEDAGTTSKPYKEVTVTPLASGGTLPIYLMYRGKVSTSADDYESSTLGDYLIGREFHSWLSGGASSSLTPLNVDATASMKGEPITFHVPDSEYTLSMHSKYSATDNSNNMGGFWVLVINHNDNPFTPTIIDGKGLNIQTNIPDGKGITKIEAPDENKNIGNIAPQMICIGHEWLWPREGKMIHNAYPTTRGIGFEGWVKDSQGAANGSWYGSGKYDESLVTTRNM